MCYLDFPLGGVFFECPAPAILLRLASAQLLDLLPYVTLVDPLRRPPLELTSLGLGLEPGHSHTSSHHDTSMLSLPKITVPGSQPLVGTGDVGGDVLASMEKLKGRR